MKVCRSSNQKIQLLCSECLGYIGALDPHKYYYHV